MASKAKLSRPVAIRCENVVRAANRSMLTSMVRIPEIPMLNAIGTPMTNKKMKVTTNTIISKNSIGLVFPVLSDHFNKVINIKIGNQKSADGQYQVNKAKRQTERGRPNPQVEPGIGQPDASNNQHRD